ncbi:MAG: type IV pilus assembly protein PilM [Pseudomonadota bacterium]
MLFKKQKLSLGLDIGSHSIKIAEISQSRHGLRLESFGVAPVPRAAIVEGTVREQAQVVARIGALVGNLKIKGRRTATSIAGYSVIIKKINLPLMSDKELEETITVEAAQYIPFDINDVYIDFQILGIDPEKAERMDVMLVAAKRETIDGYSDLIRESGLIPTIIDVDAFALENAFEAAYDTDNLNVALVDIGASKMNINILINGMSAFTRDASFGGDQITEEIQSRFSMTYEAAELLKMGGNMQDAPMPDLEEIFTSICSQWIKEIRLAIDFYYANYPDHSLSKIVLSGGSSKIVGLKDLLQMETDIPVEMFNPFSRMEIEAKRFDPDYVQEMGPQATIAVGLALRTIER